MQHLTINNGAFNYCQTPYGVVQGSIVENVNFENVESIPCPTCRYRARMMLMGCDHFVTDKQEIIPFESVNRTEMNVNSANIVFDDGERLPLSEQEYLKFRLAFVDWRSNA